MTSNIHATLNLIELEYNQHVGEVIKNCTVSIPRHRHMSQSVAAVIERSNSGLGRPAEAQTLRQVLVPHGPARRPLENAWRYQVTRILGYLQS